MKVRTVISWAGAAMSICLTGCHGGPLTHAIARQEAEQRWKLARADVKARLAKAEFDAGRLERAAKEVEGARALDPGNATLRLLDAQVHLNEGRVAEADALADSLIGDPQVGGQAHYLKAVIQQQRGDWEAAAASYATAVQLDPQDAAALVAAVGACLQIGDVQAADELIRVRRKELSWSGGYHAAAAEVCERQGDWGAAVRAWRRVVDLVDDGPALERLANAAYRAGQWSEALAALEAQLAADETAAGRPAAALHHRVALCRQKLGEPELARRAAVAALQADPEHLAATRLLVELLIEASELELARDLAEQALATFAAGDGELRSAAAILALRAGDTQRAKHLAEQMLRTDDRTGQELARRLVEQLGPTVTSR